MKWWYFGLASVILGWSFHPKPVRPRPAKPRPSITQGARLYQRACLSCHGPRGDGQALVLLPDGSQAPRLDALAGTARRPAAIARMIAQGRGAMPGFSEVLNPDQVRSLALYVESLNPSSAPSKPSGEHDSIP